MTDALGRLTEFTYDTRDRVTEVKDAANGITAYAYDANDNLTSAHDPNTNPVERNVYDLRNRLKTRTDAKNLNTQYEYDGVGNLKKMTDRKGQVTDYTYDALNRLVQIQDPDRTTTYTYDLAGNLAKISDTLSGEILMSYDALDRLTEVVTGEGTVSYAYDAIGRRTSRTLSGGDVTSYTYDKANRLKTVTLRGRTATYTYDAAGRLTEKSLPNGIKATYSYDDADRVSGIAYTRADDSSVESVAYAYDAGGQRISRSESSPQPLETAFAATYDEANRLTSITIAGEPFTLTYDDNGNLVSKSGPTTGTTTYAWSARNQLLSLSGPAGSAAFKYDALGRRTENTVNGQTTGFVYDGMQAIAELRGGGVDTVYHTGMQIDEVLARYASSGNRTLLQDALMSFIAQTNDAANAENFYAYSPYGETATLGPDSGNSLQYTGRENDGTGLYHYRARYYEPVLKRFATEDPIGLVGGVNLYAYVGGNPVLYTDPTGEVAFVAVAAVIGGAVGAVSNVISLRASGNVSIGQLVTGALVGAGTGAVAGAGLSMGWGIAGGAAFGAWNNYLTQLIKNGGAVACVDASEVLGSAYIGALGGAVGGAFQGMGALVASPVGGRFVTTYSTTLGAIMGSFTGFVGQAYAPASIGGLFPSAQVR